MSGLKKNRKESAGIIIATYLIQLLNKEENKK